MTDNEIRAFATLIIFCVVYALVDTWQEKRLRREVERLDELMRRIAMVQANQIAGRNIFTNAVTISFTQDAIGTFKASYTTNK